MSRVATSCNKSKSWTQSRRCLRKAGEDVCDNCYDTIPAQRPQQQEHNIKKHMATYGPWRQMPLNNINIVRIRKRKTMNMPRLTQWITNRWTDHNSTMPAMCLRHGTHASRTTLRQNILASPCPPRPPRLPRPPCLACPTRLTCSAPGNARFAASPRLLPRPMEGPNRPQKLRIPRSKLRWSEMQWNASKGTELIEIGRNACNSMKSKEKCVFQWLSCFLKDFLCSEGNSNSPKGSFLFRRELIFKT